ncbi:MAG: hypothetical protein DRI90_25390 [Deltaproteobacteria bacterium]|nr:MAG: hypothetical protein DRI90_25390 [Deltaproteobacteria bacterium]
MKRGRGALVRKDQLARATAEITRLKGLVGKGLYEIGRLLDRVQREDLWREGKFANFDEYVVEAVDMSRTNAYQFMRIARHFNAEIAKRYGASKLEAAIRYLEVTPADERPGDLMAAQIQVRGVRGRYRLVSLHEATAQQIYEAVRLMKGSKRGAKRVPKAFRGRMERLAEKLPQAPTGTRSGERVRVLRGDDGRLALTFQAIPYDELGAFVKALQEHAGGSGADEG